MNRKAKRELYDSVDINTTDNDRKIWKATKPIFSNENPMGEKVVFIEDHPITSNDKVIA